jgi:hypothetical protein
MERSNLMSRLKTLGLVVVAVAALVAALTTTSAFAELPDVHVGAGLTYPSTGEGTVGNGTEVIGTLETEIGEKLTTTKLTISTELTRLTSLGPTTLQFTGVGEKAGNECHTAGLGAGTVLFAGEYHVVYTSLSPLGAEVLILYNEVTVLCNKEKLKIKIKGPGQRTLNVVAGKEVNEYKLDSACKKGKQEPNEYYNEEGKLTPALLLVNFGLGFEKGCYFGSPLTMHSSKLVDFLF